MVAIGRQQRALMALSLLCSGWRGRLSAGQPRPVALVSAGRILSAPAGYPWRSKSAGLVRCVGPPALDRSMAAAHG